MNLDLTEIEEAAERIAGSIVRTPFLLSRTLSNLAGAELYIKFENLQFTASFKERGAYNRLSLLPPEFRDRGVIAMSAGNHAQGVAYHARRLGIPAVIVMPLFTPFVKIRHTEDFGARVVLAGESLGEAGEKARSLEKDEGLFFVHPYDDEAIIAGQGTVGLEMLQDCPELDTIVVPVGGGGLIAGITVAARALKPEIEIIGVETEFYPSLFCNLHGEELPVGGDTVAEGIAVDQVGRIPLQILTDRIDDVLLVGEEQLEQAISYFIGIEKTVAEGAGAAGLAAILANRERFRGKRVGLILSGGNIDARLLAGLLMRNLVREGRIARLCIEIPDRPGMLARVAGLVGEARGNIIEVTHQRVFAAGSVRDADLDLVIESRDAEHMQGIVNRIRDEGYTVRLLDFGSARPTIVT